MPLQSYATLAFGDVCERLLLETAML